MIFVGIDPGSAGGIVAMAEDGRVLETWKMPEDLHAITALLGQFRDPTKFRVFIEQIPKFCGAQRFAERNVMGSAIAVLYGNYMFCCGVMHGLGNPPILLSPLKWQNAVKCRNTERLDRSAWKNKLKARAQELFPGTRVTLAVADALLIAHAGRTFSGV